MPPSQLRGRPVVTQYVYDDLGRIARTYTASPWTVEDRVLLIAWEKYRATLCPGCQEPTDKAWHPDMDGEYEVTHRFTCHSCTARASSDSTDGRVKPVTYPRVVDTRDYSAKPLPPFDLDDPGLKP